MISFQIIVFDRVKVDKSINRETQKEDVRRWTVRQFKRKR